MLIDRAITVSGQITAQGSP